MLIIKALISAIVIVAVAEIAGRMPRVGALLLTLPIVSIIAFVMTWGKDHDMNTIASLARETLLLVPLGLPFFIPFAISNRTGLSFWPSFAFGVLLASLTIGTWFWISSPPTNRQPEIENRQ